MADISINSNQLNKELGNYWMARAQEILTPEEFAQFSLNERGQPTASPEIVAKFLKGLGAEPPPSVS